MLRKSKQRCYEFSQHHSPKNSQGFTLIELLVSIAIIGILSAVVFVSLATLRTKSKDAKVKSDVHQIKVALEGYAAINGGYPGPGNGPDGLPFWCIGSEDCIIANTQIRNNTDLWETDEYGNIVAFAHTSPAPQDLVENLAAALLPKFARFEEFQATDNAINKGYIYVSCEHPNGHLCPLVPTATDGSDKAYLIYPQTEEVKAMQVGTFEEMTCNQHVFPQCAAEVVPCTEWVYSAWSDCVDGTQTRTVTGKLPASNCSPDPTDPIVLTRSCTPPNICTGTLNCSGDQASCLLVAGCEWVTYAGTCDGSPNGSQYCSDGDQSSCEYKPGCSWGGGTPPSCTGSPSVLCSSRWNDTSCAEINGCSWGGANCSGSYTTAADCSNFNNNPTSCNANSGCSYPGNGGDCSAFGEYSCPYVSGCTANTFSCSSIGSEGECNAHSGCSYSYDEESGTGTCNGNPFENCTGSYDDGSCNGTYYASNSCSGLSESSCQSTYGCTYNSDSCIGTATCDNGNATNCSVTGCTYYAGSDDYCSGTPSCIGDVNTCTHVTGCSWMQDADGCRIQEGHSCALFSNTSQSQCTTGGYDSGQGGYKSTGCTWSQ